MATWADLEAELAQWEEAGERPMFWWRDDDTQAPTDALARLRDLAAKYAAPLHLAVIPEGTDPALKPFLEANPDIFVLQHGLRHKNHEPKGARASEMGEIRPLEETEADLKRGWQLLHEAGLPNILPVMTPPWNRIGDKVLAELTSWGFRMVSRFDARDARHTDNGLLHINGHIEPLRWRPDAIFAGEAKTLAQCVEHLRAKRTGEADKDEPTGVLTHHLQTPEEVWDFCDALAERLTHRNRIKWVTLAEELERA